LHQGLAGADPRAAIPECEEHGWMQDRADPHARKCALIIARQEPPSGVSPDDAAASQKCGKRARRVIVWNVLVRVAQWRYLAKCDTANCARTRKRSPGFFVAASSMTPLRCSARQGPVIADSLLSIDISNEASSGLHPW
jgi:hypothetical protein